jgi:hypothetical protein
MTQDKKKTVKKVKLIPPRLRDSYNHSLMLADAVKAYNRSEMNTLAVYGIDEDTTTFIRAIWENLAITRIVVTDPSPEKMSDISREMGGKRFSLNRWITQPSAGFLADDRWPLIIVSEEYYAKLRVTKKSKGIKLKTLKQLSRRGV